MLVELEQFRARVSGVTDEGDADHLVETKGRRADGGVVNLEYVTKEQKYQGRTVQMVAVRDITERKRAEAALCEAQRLDRVGWLAALPMTSIY